MHWELNHITFGADSERLNALIFVKTRGMIQSRNNPQNADRAVAILVRRYDCPF